MAVARRRLSLRIQLIFDHFETQRLRSAHHRAAHGLQGHSSQMFIILFHFCYFIDLFYVYFADSFVSRPTTQTKVYVVKDGNDKLVSSLTLPGSTFLDLGTFFQKPCGMRGF